MAIERLWEHTRSEGKPGCRVEATHSTRPPTMATALCRIVDVKWGCKGDRADLCFWMDTWTSQGSEER